MHNNWFFAAAILSFLVLIGHAVVFAPKLLPDYMNSALSERRKALIMVFWHGVTSLILINGMMLLLPALSGTYSPQLAVAAAIQFIALAVIFTYLGITRLKTLKALPQWIAFFLIGGLALVGAL